ncbi:small-conductance mechanosensitive channel [Arthrobacter pigmenti]|uniref:Small-conductance mechanosensitive channel n=1 Tax=Arthrobacter pigmenti TaxID=271432 RepID=A0A846RZE9_9MICC|nr:mechanosensitive ion channel domain-containing protein [Arthrobacter pigmenti]NJC23561.1 small-conductance mechanosensitive channel [Arthrobacter pigmenti]
MDFLEAIAPILAIAGAVLAAVVLGWILRKVATHALRKVPKIQEVTRKARGPLQAVLAVLGIRIALGATARDTPWFPPVDYVLVLALIFSLAWLLVAVLSIIETVVLRHYENSGRDYRRGQRLKTQIMLARRVAVAVIITLALASVLLTIDEVRALGAGILASAGLISIVAGLAVQSSLSNVFAGVQLAFTDAIRVDDVVLVEGEMGTIEEITMTYVVVQAWDERRLILPSTYFTSTPFENWTRRRSELLGTVELDLDWRVPIEQMRSHLREVLDASDLWDGRTGTLQITQATDGVVRARILVSAADSGALWDLQCLVREKMVGFIQTRFPDALPRQRWEAVTASSSSSSSAPHTANDDVAGHHPRDGRLFTGSPEAERRREDFSGPGEDALDEREARKAS